MNGFEVHTLGPEANEYVLDRLEHGHSLSRHLRRKHDLRSGRVVTRLPLGAAIDHLDKFEWGGKLPVEPGSERYGRFGDSIHKMTPIPDTNYLLAGLIEDFLKVGEGRVCIFENYLANYADPWLKRAKSRVLFYGDEVYHVVDDQDAGLDAIETTIREAHYIPVFVGTLSTLPHDPQLASSKGRLVEDDMQALTEGAEKIIVGAYDGEGYLIWSRPQA